MRVDAYFPNISGCGEKNLLLTFLICLAFSGIRQEEYPWIYREGKEMSREARGGVIRFNCGLISG